jgi:hypothetical protein
METERALRAVWEWLPTDVIDLEVDPFVDAVVHVPTFGSPHRPADRFGRTATEVTCSHPDCGRTATAPVPTRGRRYG